VEAKAILDANRVILSHFDSYSAALVFARFGRTLLLPDALPATAVVAQPPAQISLAHDGDAAVAAVVERYQLNAAELVRMTGFDVWIQADAELLRVHLLRFTTFLAPAEAITPHGGVFSPISNLRGSSKLELELVRQGFILILGGDARSG
jgi:hypothetical protein